jgi:hypothetical protein
MDVMTVNYVSLCELYERNFDLLLLVMADEKTAGYNPAVILAKFSHFISSLLDVCVCRGDGLCGHLASHACPCGDQRDLY